jgi:hypothetical protein
LSPPLLKPVCGLLIFLYIFFLEKNRRNKTLIIFKRINGFMPKKRKINKKAHDKKKTNCVLFDHFSLFMIHGLANAKICRVAASTLSVKHAVTHKTPESQSPSIRKQKITILFWYAQQQNSYNL